MPGPLCMHLMQNSPALVKAHDEIVGPKNEGSVCHLSWIIVHEIVIPTGFVTLKHYSEYLRKRSIFSSRRNSLNYLIVTSDLFHFCGCLPRGGGRLP